jgi:cytochrome b561
VAERRAAAPKVESIARTATRVAAGDDRTRYDTFALSLHWLTVVLVLLEFGLAETWTWFARPTRHQMVVAHMSFGIVLLAVVLARIAWRLIPGHQMPPSVSGRVEMASKAVHYLLYLMLLAQAVLGFVLRWGGKEAMSFFGLQIPPLIAPLSRPTHGLIGDLHHWNGWAIIGLAAGHAAAALYHHFVVRDRVLVRMAPWVRPRTG